MTDPVGAALGVAGLFGLFNTTLEVVELISLGRAYAKDYEIIQTKFEVQKIRLITWGISVRLLESDNYDGRLESPIIRPTTERILNNIKLLLSDEKKLSRLYGLRVDDDRLALSSKVIFREIYRRFQERLLRTQKTSSILTK
jgi:HET-S-like prion-inhibition and propagation protein